MAECITTMDLYCLSTAEITKANEEVMKVINLYDEVINKADIGSLLVDDNHGKLASYCVSDSRQDVLYITLI